MKPVDPRVENLRPEWARVVYAEHQAEYTPLPSLQERRPSSSGDTIATVRQAAQHILRAAPTVEAELLARWVLLHTVGRTNADRVVSVWEPDDREREWLWQQISQARPIRISLMLHTFGQPLQPIRLVVGEFEEPYDVHGRERAYDAAGRFEKLNEEVTGQRAFSVTGNNDDQVKLSGERIPWKQEAPPGPPDPPHPKNHNPVG